MRLSLFISLTLFIFSFSLSAQVAEKTEEKAKRKSEQRLDQKIDKGIDSGLDAIEGLFSKKKKKKKKNKKDDAGTDQERNSDEARTNAMMKLLGSSDVDVKESYSFDHRIIILMEETDKKGRKGEGYEMAYLTKDGSSIMGMEMDQEGAQTEIIYDLENLEIISLINTDGQKIGTTMTLDPSDVESMNREGSEETTGLPQFRKTGNSKVISGYNCDEYVVENTEEIEDMEGEITYWITEEAELDWLSTMSGLTGYSDDMPSIYEGTGYPENGSLIQMIIEEEDGSGSIMTVKEIQKNANVSFKTSGYTFMNIPGGRN